MLAVDMNNYDAKYDHCILIVHMNKGIVMNWCQCTWIIFIGLDFEKYKGYHRF